MDALYVKLTEVYQEGLKNEIRNLKEEILSSEKDIANNKELIAINSKRAEVALERLQVSEKELAEYKKQFVANSFDSFMNQINEVRKSIDERIAREEKELYEKVCEAVQDKIHRYDKNNCRFFQLTKGAKILLGTKAYQVVAKGVCHAATKTLFGVPFVEVVEDTDNVYLNY